MIKLENTDIYGWEAAIRGMRNPMNSWDMSDSEFSIENNVREGRFKQSVEIGENDLKLMKSLSKAGDDHGKFLRMINVAVDITAPLYWWKEFDTYKVGTVANSCSTMHKIHAKEFELDDFSHEHLFDGIDLIEGESDMEYYENPTTCLDYTIRVLNHYRNKFIETMNKPMKDNTKRSTVAKQYWWQMIQLLPSSYNQKRTIQLNYQVLKVMYFSRGHHKLDEWKEFCKWCESLPYFKEICLNDQ